MMLLRAKVELQDRSSRSVELVEKSSSRKHAQEGTVNDALLGRAARVRRRPSVLEREGAAVRLGEEDAGKAHALAAARRRDQECCADDGRDDGDEDGQHAGTEAVRQLTDSDRREGGNDAARDLQQDRLARGVAEALDLRAEERAREVSSRAEKEGEADEERRERARGRTMRLEKEARPPFGMLDSAVKSKRRNVLGSVNASTTW